MNSVERVRRALNFEETDRVPFGMFGSSHTEKAISEKMGFSSVEDMYKGLGIDLWDIWFPLKYVGEQRYYNGEKADFWGIPDSVYKDGDSSSQCPLADISSIEDVERYKWPDIKDFTAEGLTDVIDNHSDFAIVCGVWAPIFHNLTWLCGFENTLVNLMTEEELSLALIEKIADFWVAYTRKTLDVAKGKVHIVQNCNDFGTQASMIISPDTFRKFFKPVLKRLYDVIKEYGVKVMQHSCGSIEPIIPDLIEIGVDILNPIQVSASNMDIEFLAGKYGGKVVFYGGIDTQHVLPEGPVERIKEETRRTLQIMNKYGGYILAGSQGLEMDIPVEHIKAMYDEGKNFGRFG